MKTITHEGQEYVLKTEVDGIVRERLSKVTETKRTAEKRVQELETQLEDMGSKVKGAEAMASQLATLQDELAVSNQRYDRHQAIAAQGITDPEVRDLVEWQYNKAMDSKAKKDKIPMGEWMATMKEGGDVPTVLKPYFQAPQNQEAPTQSSSTQAQLQELGEKLEATPRSVPTTNQGVAQNQSHNTNGDVWKRAGQDFEFYQQNRKELKKQYYQRRNNRFKV
jgi:uncharacterized protein involved in exopolysaccharide biosynthesis